MLLSIAWRNIWRNPTRSFVVIGAIIVGIWSLVFLFGFLNGIITGYVSTSIENETSHLQIHSKKFKADPESKNYILSVSDLVQTTKKSSNYEAHSTRILANGMVASAKSSKGIIIKGIDAKQEEKVTRLAGKLIDGKYLGDQKSNPILLSKTMAEDLNVKVRKKVNLTFQDVHGNLVAAAFKVAGIYDSKNTKLDEMYVFIRDSDLKRLLDLPENTAHEIALLSKNLDDVDGFSQELSSVLSPTVLVETYKEIAPDLELFNSQLTINMIIFTTIVMLALIFGIINTMLMAVLERVRELGMLMAVGMNKGKVFGMIVMETVLVSLIGAPIGMLIGYLTTRYFARVGFDLSSYAGGLENFGVSKLVYPSLPTNIYFIIAIAMVITAFLGAIYPAWKAIQLKPVEALRKI